MNRLKKQALVMFILFAVFTVLGFISIIVIEFVDALQDVPFLPIGAALITLVYAAIAFSNLYRLLSYNEQIKSLHIENRYNLSRESLFFNYPLFENRVNKLVKKHKKE